MLSSSPGLPTDFLNSHLMLLYWDFHMTLRLAIDLARGLLFILNP